MKLGVMSLGGKSSAAILEEGKKYFDEVIDFDLRKMEVHTSSKGIDMLYDSQPLEVCDCMYIRGSYKYALVQRAITEGLWGTCYLPILPNAFTVGHNKYLSMIELQKQKVPIPESYIVAKVDVAKKLLERVHYPIIMKIPHGSQGKGVLFADSPSSAKSIIDTLEVFHQPYMVQEYVETNATDIRAMVVGDKVVAAMKRKAAQMEARANTHQGGKGTAFVLSPETEAIAVRSAKAVGAEICGVDILEAQKAFVIEVNLSPTLKGGISEATGKNVAGMVCEFLALKTKEFLRSHKNQEFSKMLDDEKSAQHEFVTNLSVKAGVIKLPPVVAERGGFTNDDEVSLIIRKGKVIIKKDH